jgi:shikimate kinase
VLVTGMSGTGKSTVLAELARRGHRVVDTDYGGYSAADDSGQVWRDDRIDALLTGHTDGTLFLAGTVPNQRTFYPRFDAVVLLSAPLEVMLDRVAARDGNPFGKTAEQRRRIVADTAAVEPLLRAGATAEIVTLKPPGDVADELEAIAARPAG